MLPRFLLQPEGIKRGVSVSIGISLLTKGLGFLVQLSIVYHFGAQAGTDVFFWCLTLLLSLSGLITSLNVAVVVPHGIHLLNVEGKNSMRRFLATITRNCLLIALSAALLIVLFPAAFAGLMSKFDQAVIHENIGLIRLVFLAGPVVVMTALFTDVLSIFKMFSVAAALEALKSLAFLGFFLLLRGPVGENSMALGFLLGSLVHFAALAVVLRPKIGTLLSWRSGGRLSSEVRTNTGYALMGHAAAFAFTAYVAYLLSGFEAGIFTAMNYGLLLIGLLQVIFISRVCNVAGVYFMELYAQRRLEDLNALFQKYLKLSLLIFLMITPFLYVFGDEIVSLVFQRGRFRSENVAVTGEFFRLFVLSLPILLINLFFAQLVYAARKLKVAFYLQVAYNLVNIVVVGFMIGRIGYQGYPVGLLMTRLWQVFVIWICVQMLFPFLHFGSVVLYLLKTGGTVAIATLIALSFRGMHERLLYAVLSVLILGSILLWKENRSMIIRIISLLKEKVRATKFQ